jgi:RNA polymerase sigma-70 factor (ECF subfamily)
MSSPIEPVPNPEFFRLYAMHEVALHTFVRLMLPTREDAAEVMQEVMIALWQGCSEAREFRPWAFAVARNKALMHLRKRSRDRHVFDEELVNRLADRAALHEEGAPARREALDDCLEKLPATQREIVLMAYTKGTRIDELALRRSQTPMALYKLLHRIRRALMDCVERTLSEEKTA